MLSLMVASILGQVFQPFDSSCRLFAHAIDGLDGVGPGAQSYEEHRSAAAAVNSL